MSDLNELFNRQPPYSEDDITQIITHYREARASYLSGVKPEKATPGGPKKKASLAALGLAKPKATGGLDL